MLTTLPGPPSPQPTEFESAGAPLRRADAAAALRVWRPANPLAALGLATDYLSRKEVFARLPFGEWTRTLAHQAGRGHQLFVVDGRGRVVGYVGWALTEEALAQAWVEDRAALRDDQCRAGDCVIVNAWAADSTAASAKLAATARELFKDQRRLYFKRFYRDGRVRPVRLCVNGFVASRSPQGRRRSPG